MFFHFFNSGSILEPPDTGMSSHKSSKNWGFDIFHKKQGYNKKEKMPEFFEQMFLFFLRYIQYTISVQQGVGLGCVLSVEGTLAFLASLKRS